LVSPLLPPAPSRSAPRRRALASTLVHGNDETGVSALATGIALRAYGKFRWVDCAEPAPSEEPPTHWIFSRGSDEPEVERIDRSELVAPSWTPSSLQGLVAPSSPEEERRLASFLSLPELYQRLGARDPEGDDDVAILVANVDALSPSAGALRLDDPTLHERLHRAGIALFATARNPPTRSLSRVFDRVYAVDVPPGASWSYGQVALEKYGDSTDLGNWIPVFDAWRKMDLDPTLLPPL
jgi:hypothetical protein